MVNSFQAVLHKKYPKGKFGFLSEFDCENGIADVVIYERRKNWKKNARLGLIQARWVYALRELPYRQIFTTDYLREVAGVSKKRARQALQEFAQTGFCLKKANKDTWVKIKQPQLVTKKIWAIEAKLNNWRRALWQAYRYLDFAHEAWVLLDEESSRPAIKNITEFQRLNIGLSSISTSGKITRHFSPLPSLPKSKLKYWQANSAIAARAMISSDVYNTN